MSSCLQSCVKDALRGIALLTALGALGLLLCGLHALSWATVTDLAVSWFALLASFLGGALCLLGCLGSLGLAPAIYCLTGATLVLLPLEGLLVWAAHAHPSQLRWLADRDQTYALSGILDWTDGHGTLAAGLAALWLVLQAAAVLLGAVYCCWPGGRRYKHPWDRYWVEGDEGRDPLLPPRPAGEADAAGGYHTPPSRFGTPHSSPGARLPPVLVIEQPSAPSAPMAYPIL